MYSLGPAFNLINAGSSAQDWYAGGALAGGTGGCIVGAVVDPVSPKVACMRIGGIAAPLMGWVGAGIGFVLGGLDAPGAGAFEWGPDQVVNIWKP